MERLCNDLSIPYYTPQGVLGTIFNPFNAYYGFLLCASSTPLVYIIKKLVSASSFPELR